MTYQFTYDGTSRPRWVKSFTASSGETFSVDLVFENHEDRATLDATQAYAHMENLAQFVKDQTNGLEIVQLGDPMPQGMYPFKGTGDWEEIDWALQEISKWWSWAYFNDDFESGEQFVEEVPTEEDPA